MESPVTIINGNQYNFGDINGGTLNLGNNPKEERKFGVTIPENLVPRRDMLDRLEAEFASHNCVVVSGIGGSGKTSLAYLYAKEKEFNNIIWITVNGKIEDVFVDRIAGLLLSNEDYEKFSKIEDKQTKLDIIKNTLSQIAGNNLLVLDINSNNDETKQEIESDLYNYLPANYWKTLVLTRTHPESYDYLTIVEMEKMAIDDAKELFKRNWNRNTITFTEEQLREITKQLHLHPLLIEQTAIVLSKGHEKSAEQIIDKIKNNSKINNDRTKKILGSLVAKGKNERQDIYTYLINLCNIENLSEDEIDFLAVYVTWPEEPINYEVIETLLVHMNSIATPIVREIFKDSDDETMKQLVDENLNEYKARKVINLLYENREDDEIKQYFKEILDKCNEEESNTTLDSLVEKGILSRNSADQYTIHSLIADVLREQIEIENHDYSEYFGNIEKVLDDDIESMLLHKYSKCIASSFINYGICKDIVLFREFLNNMYNNGDLILYNLPEPKYSDMIKELANNAESYQAAHLYNAAARVEEVRYHLQEAKSLYEKGLEVINKEEGSTDNLFLKGGLLNNLALLEAQKLGDLDAAKEHYKEAIEIDRNLPESPVNRESLADSLNNLALLEAQKLGDLDAAKEYYQEAIEIDRNLPESPVNRKYLATGLSNLANLEEKLGDLDAAKEHYNEAIEIDRDLPESSENRKSLTRDLNNLAMLEEKLDDLDAAKEHYQEAIEIDRNLPESPENRKSLAIDLNNLAMLEKNLDNFDAAKEHYKEAIEIDRKLPESPENRKSLATDLNNLAGLEENLGDLDAAKEHWKEAIEIKRKLPESPENLLRTANELTGLGMVDAQLGDINSAKEHLKEALEIAKQIQNEEYIRIIENLLSRLQS